MKLAHRWLRPGLIALALLAPRLVEAAPRGPTYILNGYSLSGLKGIDTQALEARLGRKEGARITQADIDADTAIVTAELKAHGMQGRLATTLAEKHGHVWIIFDLVQVAHPALAPINGHAPRLAEQRFQGAARLSPKALAAASGLAPGQAITPAQLLAARTAILRAYAKVLPGAPVPLAARIQRARDGEVTLIWVIAEPAAVRK